VVSELRAHRIADRILEELSDILLRQTSDPRLTGISVTGVKIDREMSYADVYISALEGNSRAKDVLSGLEHAQGFLRHELSQRIELRYFPRLRFRWDATFERADRIERLIVSLHKGRNENSPGSELAASPGNEKGKNGNR
jgi:ribosome-binding factor A